MQYQGIFFFWQLCLVVARTWSVVKCVLFCPKKSRFLTNFFCFWVHFFKIARSNNMEIWRRTIIQPLSVAEALTSLNLGTVRGLDQVEQLLLSLRKISFYQYCGHHHLKLINDDHWSTEGDWCWSIGTIPVIKCWGKALKNSPFSFCLNRN